MTPLRIMVDLDGVLHNWDMQAICALDSKGYGLTYPSISWRYIEDNVSKKDWQWLWEEKTIRDYALFQGEATSGEALRFVRRNFKKGHQMVCVTSRPRYAEVIRQTLVWLADFELPFNEVHVLGRGVSKGTVPRCDVYVDDKLKNLEDIVEAQADHTEVALPKLLLWTQPHNSTCITEFCIERVTSWKEVQGTIDKLDKAR